MTQIPTTGEFAFPAASFYTAGTEWEDIRDEVAREVFGAANYLALNSDTQQTLNRLGEDAAHEFTQLWRWYAYTLPAFPAAALAIPAPLQEYYRALWTHKAIRRWRSAEKSDAYWKAWVAPLHERLSVFFDSNFDDTTTIPNDAMSVGSILRKVISELLRQRTPVVPPFSQARELVRSEFVKLWNGKRWRWRIRQKIVTITAADDTQDGGLTLPEGDADIIDGIASKHIVLQLSANGGRRKVQWLDSTRFGEARANFSNASNAAPRYFYDEDQGTPPATIYWLPRPDINYTAYVSIVVGAPAFTNEDPTFDDGLLQFNQMPPEFRHHLVDRIFARILSKWGREDVDSSRAIKEMKDEFNELADNWEDRGAHEYTARGHHMKRFNTRGSYGGSNTIGQLD